MPNPEFASPRKALAEAFNASQGKIELVIIGSGPDDHIEPDAILTFFKNPSSSPYSFDILGPIDTMSIGRFRDHLMNLAPTLMP